MVAKWAAAGRLVTLLFIITRGIVLYFHMYSIDS
jgi:hypothetical protein